MIIAGIDIGTYTAIAIVEKLSGQIITLQKINTNQITPSEMFDVFNKFIIYYKVRCIGYEKPIYHTNIKSMQKYIEKVSTIKLIASINKIPVIELFPNNIKKSIVGFGKASKYQVKEMVKNAYNINTGNSYDTSDAIAIAFALINKLESETHFMHYKNS